MFCENCGASIPDDSKFCAKCGTTLDGETPSAKAPTPVPQPVQVTAPVVVASAQPQSPYVSVTPQYSPQSAGYGPAQIEREPLSVGNYIGMFFLSAIPMVGFIMLLIWAFGSGVNINRKNYARAVLIMGLIAMGVWIVLLVLGLIVGGSLFNNLY